MCVCVCVVCVLCVCCVCVYLNTHMHAIGHIEQLMVIMTRILKFWLLHACKDNPQDNPLLPRFIYKMYMYVHVQYMYMYIISCMYMYNKIL